MACSVVFFVGRAWWLLPCAVAVAVGVGVGVGRLLPVGGGQLCRRCRLCRSVGRLCGVAVCRVYLLFITKN